MSKPKTGAIGGGLLFSVAMAFFYALFAGKKKGPPPQGEVIIHQDELRVLDPDDPSLANLPPPSLNEDLSERSRRSLVALHVDLDTMDIAEDATAAELAAGLPYATETARLMRAHGATGDANFLEGLIAAARAKIVDLGGTERVSGIEWTLRNGRWTIVPKDRPGFKDWVLYAKAISKPRHAWAPMSWHTSQAAALSAAKKFRLRHPTWRVKIEHHPEEFIGARKPAANVDRTALGVLRAVMDIRRSEQPMSSLVALEVARDSVMKITGASKPRATLAVRRALSALSRSAHRKA